MRKVFTRKWSQAVAALGLAVATVGVGLAANPAEAASCVHSKKWVDYAFDHSDVFNKASGTTCRDLNAEFTYTYNDRIRGWYKSSTGWHVGSNQFVAVTTCDCGLKVLLTSVIAGTPVRGEAGGLTKSQYVSFVH